MTNIKTLLLTVGLSIFILPCCNNSQASSQNTSKNDNEQVISPSHVSNDNLVGGYSFEKNGPAEMYILKNGNNFYVQFRGDNAPQQEILTSASPQMCLSCSFILGDKWQSKLISGLELGAFRILKVKSGTSFEGRLIHSGYIGGVGAAGEIWKVE